MAEYKDITPLKKQISDIKKAINSPNSDYMTGYICALSVTEGIIAELPTADVVPKSEYEALKDLNKQLDIDNFNANMNLDLVQQELDKSKSEVEKIFEEIETVINKAISIEDKRERNAWGEGDIRSFQTHQYTGEQLEELQYILADLKKKYIGE